MKSGCGRIFGCSSWIDSVCQSMMGTARLLQFAHPHALLAEGVELGGRAVSMNSHGVAAELDPSLAAKGVLFGNLAQLVREHSEQLRPFFERRVVNPNLDKFSSLNAACWSGGTLLYVPKNVRLELPFTRFRR